jgi:hypothetical protein
MYELPSGDEGQHRLYRLPSLTCPARRAGPRARVQIVVGAPFQFLKGVFLTVFQSVGKRPANHVRADRAGGVALAGDGGFLDLGGDSVCRNSRLACGPTLFRAMLKLPAIG